MSTNLDKAHEELISAGVLELVVPGGADERLWLDCDLASLAELRLGDLRGPRELDEACRSAWSVAATTERSESLLLRSKYQRCCWLLDAGRRVGIVALDHWEMAKPRLSSLYVLPEARGSGVGRRVLAAIRGAYARHDMNLHLETCWTWQRVVRYYLRLGACVYMWKRELELFWPANEPAPVIEVGQESARIGVRIDGGERTLVTARRRGALLEFDTSALRNAQEDRRLGNLPWHASGTLALAIALEGWPLVRSHKTWRKSYYADNGPPEALAYKITVWEAKDQARGFGVDAPRIPGLAYPSWDKLEEAWDEDRDLFELIVREETLLAEE